MEKMNIAFFGGGERALALFKRITNIWNNKIKIDYAVFMKGYEHEHIFCDKLEILAKKLNIDYLVSDIITDEIIDKIKYYRPIVAIGGGIWRSMIPRELFDIPKFGYIGLHGTPLPKYRGWAGINWQIINGEKYITTRMYRLSDGIDDGKLVINKKTGKLLEFKIDIDNEKHLREIFDDYLQMHLIAYDKLFECILEDNIDFIEQNENEATYSCSIMPEDCEINWNDTTKNIFNFIRSQSKPYSGAYTFFDGMKVTIWRVKPRYDYKNYVGRIPGKVVTRDKLNDHLVILTKDGGIEVLECEREDGEINKFKIFNSVKKRCKSEVEAFVDMIKNSRESLF